MKALSKYDIELVGLKLGEHEFNFAVDSAFFDEFEYSLVQNGALQAKLVLIKSETLLQLDFEIEGTIELECDRSLEKFDYPINLNERVIIKFSHEEIEGDDIETISFGAQKINVASYIFEFISVSIPMKKLHPKFQNESDDDEMVYISESHDETESNGEIDDVDPRWSELKKLINKKNQ